MERMLHIAGSMSPSGIGNYIMNVYRAVDRSKVQFDFLLCEKREVSFDAEIEALGGRIFYITRKSVNPVKNFLETMRVVRENHYRVVFRHTDIATVALDLLAARLGGAGMTTAHSHSTSTGNVRLHRLFVPMLNLMCTRRFACSKKAGQWLYGGAPFQVITNAINYEEFCYDEAKRRSFREAENLGDRPLIGHIGNFLPVKNHIFMLKIMSALVKKNPEAVLIFAGDGALRPEIEHEVAMRGLGDNVRLLGVRTDTSYILSGLDLFLFPSKYEGLPIALVEAQCAGLACLISDVITRDVDVTGNMTRMSLDEKAARWADRISELLKYDRVRPERRLFEDRGFDIYSMVKVYEDMAL